MKKLIMLMMCIFACDIQAMDMKKSKKKNNGNSLQQVISQKKANAQKKEEHLSEYRKNNHFNYHYQRIPDEGNEDENYMQIDVMEPITYVSTGLPSIDCDDLNAEQYWAIQKIVENMKMLNKIARNTH